MPFCAKKSRIHLISNSTTEVPPAGYGGSEQIIAELAAGLVELGYNAVIYAPGHCSIPGVGHVQTSPTPTPFFSRGRVNPVNTSEHISSIKTQLKNDLSPWDIVHLNHAEHYPALKSVLEGAQIFEASHWTVVCREPILFPSLAMAKLIKGHGYLVPHSIDLDLFTYEENVSAEDFIFYAGRFTPDKGLTLLEDAAARAQRPLVLAGPEPVSDWSKTFVSRHKYVGNLTRKELVSYYRRAFALGYFSQYPEPFGLAPVEAMACGCPVLTTGQGALGETVIDGITGFHVSSTETAVTAIHNVPNLSRRKCAAHAKLYSIQSMTDAFLYACRSEYGN